MPYSMNVFPDSYWEDFWGMQLLMSAYSGETRVLKRKKNIIIGDTGEIEVVARGQCHNLSSSSSCPSSNNK